MGSRSGWYRLSCFNGLSGLQQQRVLEWGNLPFGYEAEGECSRGAEVAIEFADDPTPGPRFLCRQCAAEYLMSKTDWEGDSIAERNLAVLWEIIAEQGPEAEIWFIDRMAERVRRESGRDAIIGHPTPLDEVT